MLIRRNVSGKYHPWKPLDAWQWEWQELVRFLRRDRTWRVEVYEGISEDPIGTPNVDAACVFVCEDKKDAVATANRVVARVEKSGIPAIDDYV